MEPQWWILLFLVFGVLYFVEEMFRKLEKLSIVMPNLDKIVGQLNEIKEEIKIISLQFKDFSFQKAFDEYMERKQKGENISFEEVVKKYFLE